MNTTKKELASERMNFRFSKETVRKLKILSSSWETNMTEVIEMIIDQVYEEHRDPNVDPGR